MKYIPDGNNPEEPMSSAVLSPVTLQNVLILHLVTFGLHVQVGGLILSCQTDPWILLRALGPCARSVETSGNEL